MHPKKLNCWEYKKCGREPGGININESGVCPAAADSSYSDINAGTCGGRFCWAVAGTFCSGEVQGTFAEKRDSCMSCDFFNLVRAEEGTANLRTKFLQFVSLESGSSILNSMSYKYIKRGKRFLIQGETGNAAYIIQRGSCLVIVEKGGELHPVAHRSEGDIVDMTALFTGEPRSAHVEAETDMEMWVLDKTQFAKISQNDPDLLDFLTELAADRFDSKRPTADRTIGEYTATAIIGRGGYSIVYQGVDTCLNTPVAIKMLRHNLAMDHDYISGFRNEAETIASLNHTNIIKLYDVEERFKTIFIITEFIEGESLRDMLDRIKSVPPLEVADYLLQVCSGLAYAHKQKIIHRDINPSNIFVQPGGQVKIIDFGLACPIGTVDIDSFGTFYIAPEQIRAEVVDQRTDIYALGITAYELVTGQKPFIEEKLGPLMKKQLNNEIPDPKAKTPDLPEALRMFILKASRRDPAERFQNMRQAADVLKTLTEYIVPQ